MRKVVVVTGAGGGMGRALCRQIAGQYQVIAIDRNADKLASLGLDSAIETLAMDIRDADLETQLDSMDIELLHGLVNLAGSSMGAPVSRIADQDWHDSFDINVTAPMRLIRWSSEKLKAAENGSIVNVGSPVGIVGANKVSYAASKAALHGLTMSAAREFGPNGIRVNLLLPGPTITDMTADWPLEKQAAIAQGSFLKRLCRPEDIAHCIEFLLSDKAAYLTGSVIDMTAGSMLGH